MTPMHATLSRTLRASATLVGAVSLILFSSCGGGGGSGISTPEPSLVVASSDPSDGQQNVALDSVVSVTFSAPLDPSSVNYQSVRVGEIAGSGEVNGLAVLDDSDPRIIRWTPTELLHEVSAHACEISGGLRSASGVRVGGDLTFSFRTGSDQSVPTLPGRSDLVTLPNTLNIGRRSHSATLLTSGDVLLAGGFRESSTLTDRAELYNGIGFALLPAEMIQARASHTATRLSDGRVLLTGGYYQSVPGQVATTEWAEVYNPGTRSFTRVGDMTTERVDHAALLLPDGRVLITGGSMVVGSSFVDHDTAEIFDPSTNTFTAHAEAMVHTRSTHVMVDFGNGKFLLYGGSDVDLRPSWYDTATGVFSPLLPAAQDGQRWGAMADTFASGGACVAGGDSLGTVLYVDPGTGFVQNTGSGLNARRAYGTATRYAPDLILIVGGYEFTTGNLSPTCDVSIEGGIGGSRTYGCEMRFPTGMVWHTATLLQNGKVLFCGGLNQTGGLPELDAAYLFTPPPQ